MLKVRFTGGFRSEVTGGVLLKPVPIFLCLLLAACAARENPADSLESFFNSVKEGKGKAAVSMLSSEALDSLAEGMNLEGIRRDPETHSVLLAGYGVSLTPDELRSISITTILERLVESPLFSAMMRDASMVTGQVSITGPTAHVETMVVFMGDTLNGSVEMVLEDDRWKLGCEGLRFAI